MTTPNLALNEISPFIGARDFDASRDFYVALGWSVTYDADNLRALELGDHCFYLQDYYQQEWCDNTMMHISVESVDDWFEFVKAVFAKQEFAGGARHSDEIKDECYGRVFHIWDPAGVLLHIAQFHGTTS